MSDAELPEEPNYLAPMMRRRLEELAASMRKEGSQVDDPQLAALLETSAETLEGLEKAFTDYEGKTEPAWRVGSGRSQEDTAPPHGDKLSEAVNAASRTRGPTEMDEP